MHLDHQNQNIVAVPSLEANPSLEKQVESHHRERVVIQRRAESPRKVENQSLERRQSRKSLGKTVTRDQNQDMQRTWFFEIKILYHYKNSFLRKCRFQRNVKMMNHRHSL
jgi:hypothetical protein